MLRSCSRRRDFLCASFLHPFVRFAQNSSVRGPSYEAPRLGLRQIALGRTDESTSHMKIHLLLKKPRLTVLLHRPAPYVLHILSTFISSKSEYPQLTHSRTGTAPESSEASGESKNDYSHQRTSAIKVGRGKSAGWDAISGSAAEVLGEGTLQKARKVHLSEPAGKPGPACGWSFPACMGEFGLFVPALQKRSSLRTSLHGQYEHPASDFPMAWEIRNIVQPSFRISFGNLRCKYQFMLRGFCGPCLRRRAHERSPRFQSGTARWRQDAQRPVRGRGRRGDPDSGRQWPERPRM